jgi:hypothetical protein
VDVFPVVPQLLIPIGARCGTGSTFSASTGGINIHYIHFPATFLGKISYLRKWMWRKGHPLDIHFGSQISTVQCV